MLSPQEIESVKFRKSINGYNVHDVDNFLEQIIKDYEKLYKENLEKK